MKPKGEREAEGSAAVIRFKRDYMGGRPEEVRSSPVGDRELLRSDPL